MTVMNGHVSVLHVVAPIVWALVYRLSCRQKSERGHLILGKAVRLCFLQAEITTKQAAALMKMDESQLNHCLRGEPGYHLSLNRLLDLPYRFWVFFCPSLMYMVVKQNVEELATDWERSA